MAPFLARVFSVRKQKNVNKENAQISTSDIPCLQGSEFCSLQQVRILLFRERCGQDRRLIFDSKAVKKSDEVSTNKPEPICRTIKESSIEKSFKLSNAPEKDCVYEWQKQSADEGMLREMIFGSVSTSYQGTTIKVHTLRAPPQIMISIVFPAPPMGVFHLGEELDASTKSSHSTSEMEISRGLCKAENHLAHSVPLDVPSRPFEHVYKGSLDDDLNSLQSNDGYSSLPGLLTPTDAKSTKLPRSGSYSSLQRRLLQNKATSIEFGLPSCSDELQDSKAPTQNRVKLGLSIVISLNDQNATEESQFQDFVFTHISLIERHVMNLKNTVIKAYLNRKKFIHLMYEGSRKLQKAIEDLYTAPRLQFPEWLNIISSKNHHDLSSEFITRLSNVLKKYDTKETNFFVSTLLTTVLTHHLAWVPTVIPTDATNVSAKNSHKHMPKWVDELAKSRPYNPLWVQLGDLYGALSTPFKLAKTVIKGSKADVVLQLLQVLSYFIRCSDICENIDEKTETSFFSDGCESSCAEDSSSKDNQDNSLNSTKTISNSIPADNLHSSSRDDIDHLSIIKKLCLGDDTICDFKKTDSKSFSVVVNPKCVVTVCSGDNFQSTEFVCQSSALCSSVDNMSLTETCKDACETDKVSQLVSSHPSQCFLSDVSKTDATFECNNPVPTFDSLGYESMEDKSKNLEQFADNSDTSQLPVSQQQLPIAILYENNSCEISSVECELHSILDCDNCKILNSRVSCETQNFSTKSESDIVREKPFEAIEEGYHSMEETQSPQRDMPKHLSELLEQYDNWAPEGLTQLCLPRFENCIEKSTPTIYKSLGWSLMAGISKYYLTDFCLQGVHGTVNEDEIKQDLLSAAQIHNLGEPISEAVCILADTDVWEIKLLSSHFESDIYPSCRVLMSSLVGNMCEAVVNMKELGLPSESCMIHLEDRLQELYFRSLSLADFLSNARCPVTLASTASILKVDVSDMPLLMAIATIHSPYLSCIIQRW